MQENQVPVSSSICKIVDYSDSECEEFVEEICVGKRGRKPSKQSNKVNKRKRGIVSKPLKSNPCLGKKCQNKCSNKFTELERQHINEFYWGLASDDRQKDYLFSCIEKNIIGRKTTPADIKRASYKYFINFRGERIKVCQQFLINTLGISQMSLRHSILKKIQISRATGATVSNKRNAYNKTNESSLDLLRKFIEKLPAVPSHYCRNKSTKLYLPTEFRNITTLYKLYLEHMKSEKEESRIVSLYVFRKVFNNDYHLGFH